MLVWVCADCVYLSFCHSVNLMIFQIGDPARSTPKVTRQNSDRTPTPEGPPLGQSSLLHSGKTELW